jgi:tetratricopeptide (TPR) repeat protein
MIIPLSPEKAETDRQLARRPNEADPIDRARWNFGRILEWHLVRGTRPGKVDHPGPKWSEKEFARAVGVQTDRTIRNWLKNKHPPKDTWKIERALFGADDARYPEWRCELQQAHARTRGIESDGGAKDNGAPVLPDADIEGQSVASKPLLLSNIPIRVPTHFMGRDDALDAIAAAFNGEEGRLAVAITAIHGLRGVGKSTLAAAYAERHRGSYRAMWWIRAQADLSLRADLVGLGIRLGWVGADDKNEDILLIYDNAIDADALRPYLPRGGGARVLVTSNAHAWRGVATPVPIHVWPKDIGADFLIARTGRGAEREDAQPLSQALGGLPLAHEQAAAYCERLDVSLGAYLRRFEAAPTKFLDDARHAPTEYGLTVAKTFSLAIDEAAKLHPAAEPLIVHAALLGADPISLFLFAEAHEKFDEPLRTALAGDGLDETVAALRAFALVDRETIADERDISITTSAIRLHRLVREVAAQRAVNRGDLMRHALIAALEAVYPDDAYDNPASWPRCAPLTPHLLSICETETTDAAANAQCAKLLDRAGSYFHGRAAYVEARPLFERALAIREKALSPAHPETATSLNNLAAVLRAQGDLAGARPLYERALAVYEKALGPEHPATASSLNNLGSLLQNQGDLAAARPRYERALAIREKAHGPEHPDTAMSLNNLAGLFYRQGDLSGARPLYKRALAIYEKVLGPEHPDTAISLNNLAFALQAQGDFAGARPLYERALAIREKVFGAEHPDTAQSLSNLASLLGKTSHAGAAEALFRRAIAVGEKTLGGEHRRTQRFCSQYARLLLDTGRAAEALRLAQTALETHEAASGPNHSWTKDSARIAADALVALDRGDEAEALRARHDIAR